MYKKNLSEKNQEEYLIVDITASPIVTTPGTAITLSAFIHNADGTFAPEGVPVTWEVVSGQLYISLSGSTSVTDAAGKAVMQATASAPSGGTVRVLTEGSVMEYNIHFCDARLAAPAVVNAEEDHQLDAHEIALGVTVHVPPPVSYFFPQPNEIITLYWDGVDQMSYILPDPPVFPLVINATKDFSASCFYDGSYEVFYDYIDIYGNVHSSMSFPLDIIGSPPPVTLPPPSFPEADTSGTISNASVVENKGVDIRVNYPQMIEGEKVSVSWCGYQRASDIPIPETLWTETRSLSVEEAVTQSAIFHIPLEYIVPAGDEYGEGYYEVGYLNDEKGLSGSADINITSAPQIESLTSNKDAIVDDGRDYATITASIKSSVKGNILSDISVSWIATEGELDTTQTFTGTDGNTSVKLRGTGNTGTSIVTATPEYGTSEGINIMIENEQMIITEQKQSDGLYPLIYPGAKGNVTFNIDTNLTSDVAGSRIHFVAPTGTTLIGATLPNQEGKYTFTPSADALSGDLTLTEDGVTWSTCTVILQAGSSVKQLTSVSDGSAQYFKSDGSSLGDPATVTVNYSCSWDYVTGVSRCLIAMGYDDIESETAGTLYINGNDKTGMFKAHAIPIFVGVTFTMAEGSPVISPTNEEVQSAFTLVNDQGADVSSYIVRTTTTDFEQPYNDRHTSKSLLLNSGAYVNELESFAVWCPMYEGSTLPEPINLCIKLDALRTEGTYTFISNQSEGSLLNINFINPKKYQFSEESGSSDYIIITEVDNSNSFSYDSTGETRGTDEVSFSIFNIHIDPTPDKGKYIFKLQQQQELSFTYPNVDDSYYYYGKTVDSLWTSAYRDSVEWYYYPQFLLLPYNGATGSLSLQAPRTGGSTSGSPYYGSLVGYSVVHEAHGWARSGNIISVDDAGFTVNANTIAFVRLHVDYQSASSDVSFKGNNELVDNNSRIHLIDNFGNHIYMTPNFGTGGGASPKMTLTINDQ